MEALRLQYNLTREEIEETLLCLNHRREGRFRKVNMWIVSILGVVVLAAYIRNPGQTFLFFLLCAVILLLFYLTYGLEHKRKKRARQMEQQGGEYRLQITDTMVGYGDKGDTMPFSQVKKMEVYSSQHMYIWKADQTVFAIPKRALAKVEEEELMRIVKKHQIVVTNIRIKEDIGYGKRPTREND